VSEQYQPEDFLAGHNAPVLVTGATGFVGRAVVRELHRRRIPTRALVRDPESQSARDLANDSAVELIKGDVAEPGGLRNALEGVTRVIHLVGIISEAGRATFENVHTGGTANLVSAAVAAGVKRLAHMSALGTRPNAVSRYHRTKWAAEQVVRGSPIEWTIFRPSLIYGPGDHFISLFGKIARFSPVLPVPGSGRARFAPVHVSQVSRAFVGAIEEQRASGQTMDLCGREVFTLPEMLGVVVRSAKKRRAIVRIPLPVARLQATLLELLFGRALRKPPPLNRDQLIMLEEDNLGDGSPADRLFGLEHPRFAEAIRV
jgi:uncharacterized protein YbjT (DUF2867 family)